VNELDYIRVKGAKENNLKNVDIELPKNKLIVFTGLSGSGKSSLAFNTIYAEGHRRFVESLSAYARQFLGQLDKPKVESITGLSPTIAIDQKTASRNPRSTVGTVTEIYDYFRLLFARIGHAYCPNCHKEIKAQTVQQIVDKIMELPEDTKLQILAPVVRGRKGEHTLVFKDLSKKGFIRARIDGTIMEIDPELKLEKNFKHTIEAVVDRIKIKENVRSRLGDSVETALNLADGLLIALTDNEETIYSKNFSCTDCGYSFEEISPRTFSFNSPYGACPDCNGLGMRQEINPELVVKDTLSINGKCFPRYSWSNFQHKALVSAAEAKGIPTNIAFKKLSKEEQDFLLYGGEVEYSFMHRNLGGKTKKWSYSYFEGVLETLRKKMMQQETLTEDSELLINVPCKTCHGARVKREMLFVKVNDKNIHEVGSLNIEECQKFFNHLILNETEQKIVEQVTKEINERLSFLNEVGLGYLTLTRSAATLSGGEAQRIRLATQIGSGLTGVLYVLDEPSIGLHQRDNDRLLASLKRLRDLGNTLIVVEHDEDTMREADYIVDIGPKAGRHGGEIVAKGSFGEILKADSLTSDYLSGRKKILTPDVRREPKDFIRITGANENNLKNVNVNIPLGVLVSVTGVSGSGKSTLINQILYPTLSNEINGTKHSVGKHKNIQNIGTVDKIVNIDQSPIGRTPRSNPATYVGVFDEIRKLYSETNEAKTRGYKPGRFSFNVPGGRCEACKGDGVVKIEMHFLSDVYVKCDVCDGKRYGRETLDVHYKGKNIHDVLEMTVDEACDFFDKIPKIFNKLNTLKEVGLGYVKLGQPATTLSGGEAQRVKLAGELSKRSTGKTIYLLDEPTTGLHIYDVHQLLIVLERLVEKGNTVLVIEHNLDVIRSSDYIIDLGPEGGDGGGTIVAEGTPEEVAKVKKSYTGKYLNKLLQE
jgi:excinuclease ABC subunit A